LKGYYKSKEEFCYSCECQLLTADEKLGPFCKDCFKKTKRKDALMKAAIRQAVVAVVPTVCPHENRHGRCRFDVMTPRHFNVLVLDKNLEPIRFVGPYTQRGADREAKRLRRQMERGK
jgi:hypothetical protein